MMQRMWLPRSAAQTQREGWALAWCAAVVGAPLLSLASARAGAAEAIHFVMVEPGGGAVEVGPGVPASVDGQRVWRQVVDPMGGSAEVRVMAGAGGAALASARVEAPAGRTVGVQYDPADGTLTELPGFWHVFAYDARAHAGGAESVHLAGSFNGWSTHATPMRRGADGVWRIMIPLDEGVHYYKFVVGGERWMNDPAADKTLRQPDGHEGFNSGLLIGDDGRELPAPEPNAIRAEAVLHEPAKVADLNVVDEELLRVMVQVQTGDVEAVRLRLREAGDPVGVWRVEPMHHVMEQLGLSRYGALVRVSPGATVRYVIELADGEATRVLTPGGLVEPGGLGSAEAFEVVMDPGFETPDWARDAVWYQVFPERFRNGEVSNDPENTFRWQSDWWATLPGEAGGQEHFYGGIGNVWWRRFGGDLQGAKEALPYLRELGITAIYFNPLFEAESMHKYDATDFRHIDDNFGVKGDWPVPGETDDPATWQWSPSDRVFLDFLDAAHRQGFRVIIDGVFNHVGRAHFAFQDVLEHGEDSRYADWFEITSWGRGGEPGTETGIQWVAWDGPNGHLPVFKKDERLGLAQPVREHIFAITRRWMAPDGDPSRGVDGWRLDVPGDVPHVFWIDWRQLVKSINPEALIIGELWGWSQPWLRGDQFDAVMNYQFAMPTLDFLADQQDAIDPSTYAQRLAKVAYSYPYQASLVMQNLYDSHDTDRLASMFLNPDRPYDAENRLQEAGAVYDRSRPGPEDWQRVMQAAAVQMGFVGAPMIYYGTEAGMWSPDDPSNRQPMIWRDLAPYDDPAVRFHGELFEWYRRVIAARRAVGVLHEGFYRPILTDDATGVLGFARELGDRRAYIVANRSGRVQTVAVPVDEPAGAQLVDVLDPASAELVGPDPDVPDSRTRLRLRADAPRLTVSGGVVTVELPAYGTAWLVSPEQVR